MSTVNPLTNTARLAAHEGIPDVGLLKSARALLVLLTLRGAPNS